MENSVEMGMNSIIQYFAIYVSKFKCMFPQGVSCLPAPGDTYHLSDCMVIADNHSKFYDGTGRLLVVTADFQ